MNALLKHARRVVRVGSATSARERWARRLLLQALERGLTAGSIELRLPNERVRIVARNDGGAARYALDVRTPRFFRRAVEFGSLGLGESFMDGDFAMAEGALEDWLTLLLRSRIDDAVRSDLRLVLQGLALRLASGLRDKATNVRAHYDLGEDLFDAFLDRSMGYSCGYARSGAETPEELQHNKYERICQKLRVEPGMRLLDIGCGYGGLLIHAARHYGAVGVGITNSGQHAAGARARVQDAGLSGALRILTGDYTELEDRFERLVSVGMLEHVPRNEYRRYFATVAQRLASGGKALLHFIGCNADKNEHDPFVQKYIFPGSNQPRLSEVAAHCESRGLAIIDVENMARHYAPTLRGWLERFRKHRGELDSRRYDERFRRMWEFYLAAGVAAAEASESALYQVLLHQDVRGPIPLLRV